MASLINSLKQHGIIGREAESIKEKFRAYKKEGYSLEEASRETAQDVLREAENNREDIIRQVNTQIKK